MSCPDVTAMVGRAYLITYLLYRIVLVRFLYSPIPQSGTLAPVGFPTTCYEDRSEGRNVFTCDSSSLPHIMKTGVRARMCSRVTHHLFALLPLADKLASSANRQILPARSFNL